MVSKIIAFKNPAPGRHTHMFMCPACGYAHCFTASELQYNGHDLKPTLLKPVKISGHIALKKCESTITEGMITFAANCSHDCAGMTMELPDIHTLTS
jgi:hypothetical protein